MTQMKEGDKVVLIGILLGHIVHTDQGEITKLGQRLGIGDDPVATVKLECGDIVSVPLSHVHLPS